MARPVHFPSGKTIDIQGLFPLKIGALLSLKASDGNLLDIIRDGSANIEQKCQFILSILNTAGYVVTLEDLSGATEKWLNAFIVKALEDNTPDPTI